jgi:uncharacterized membrane protein YphA (DoxX/SURF4 family)
MNKTNTSPINILIGIARIFTGALFVFSGLIKANDPLGFSYKLEEYFQVFQIDFLNNYSVIIAILLCSIEIILGALLLIGIWRKQVMWGLLLLIIFFTFLTFYSAFFKVVTSCGCFGDAIPLTPWQSFAKDLILLALIIFLYKNIKAIQPAIEDLYTKNIVTVGIVIISLGIGVYTFNFLPILDFLPYKVGNNLPELMRIPPGATLDEYETRYKLKNKITNEEKEMSDKEYLKTEIWKDEDWEIIGDPKTTLIKKGYQAPISDLMISDENGIENTHLIIENPEYNFIIVAYDLSQTNMSALKKLNDLAQNIAEQFAIRSVILTSSSSQLAETLSHEFALTTEFFYADAVPLKSMIRSNPGLLLMKNGTVIKKWPYHLIPSFEKLSNKYF